MVLPICSLVRPKSSRMTGINGATANQAKKLKNRWDEDMQGLLSEQITFQEIITSLAKHFKLKEEKEKLRQK